ncbi:MAG: type I-E CRISPR-associated protein Cse2/CasB, partial [Syntrophaceae bacterium]
MSGERKESTEEKLISDIYIRLKQDTAFRAALKKADNPDTEYQSWEYLAGYGIDIEHESVRLPYTTIFSAVARSGRESDGSLELGVALVSAYQNDQSSPPARARLRRILACSTVQEACAVLRPMLRLIGGKGIPISYARLLHDLNFFSKDPGQTKARWAQQFFGG